MSTVDDSVELVRFPDPIAAARAYLLEVLDGAIVTADVPATRPAEFVRVALAGGYRLDVATMVRRLAFECWSTSTHAAADLAFDVEAHVLAWANRTDTVRKVEDVSLVESRDPDSRQARFVKTVEVHFRPDR